MEDFIAKILDFIAKLLNMFKEGEAAGILGAISDFFTKKDEAPSDTE